MRFDIISILYNVFLILITIGGLSILLFLQFILKGTSPNKFYPMENCESSSITAEQISAENEDAHIPSGVLGSLKLSSKKSAVLPTTFAAYLALEAAAAKYAPKVVSNVEEIAKNKWWDSIGKNKKFSNDRI